MGSKLIVHCIKLVCAYEFFRLFWPVAVRGRFRGPLGAPGVRAHNFIYLFLFFFCARARPGWPVGGAWNCKSVSFRKIERDSWPISHGCKFWPKKSTTIQKTRKHAKSTKKYRKRARTAENVLKLGHGSAMSCIRPGSRARSGQIRASGQDRAPDLAKFVHLARIARQIWPNSCIWPGSRARSGQIHASGQDRMPDLAKFTHLARTARQIWPNSYIWPGSRVRSGQIRAPGSTGSHSFFKPGSQSFFEPGNMKSVEIRLRPKGPPLGRSPKIRIFFTRNFVILNCLVDVFL